MSFRLKLVAYFLLVSLLPLGAAGWALHAVSGRSETRRVDVRLEAGLRAVLAGYKDELSSASRQANRLASSSSFQQALQRRDRRELRRLLAGSPGLHLESQGLTLGPAKTIGAGTEFAVVSPIGLQGTLVAGVPLSSASLARLREGAGLARGDLLVVLEQGALRPDRPVSSAVRSPSVEGPHRAGRPDQYRALAASPQRASDTALALLAPQSGIDGAVSSFDRRLLIGLLSSLALIAFVAYVVGSSIVKSLSGLADAANAIARGRLDRRVGVQGSDEFARLGLAFNEMADQLEARVEELGAERARLRDANVRFGEALAATHDVDQLLRVIVETVVETTGATGGLVVGLAGEVVQSGTLSTGASASSPPLAMQALGRASRHALPLGPRLHGGAAAHRGDPRRTCGDRPRERTPAPHRRPPGPCGHAHRARATAATARRRWRASSPCVRPRGSRPGSLLFRAICVRLRRSYLIQEERDFDIPHFEHVDVPFCLRMQPGYYRDLCRRHCSSHGGECDLECHKDYVEAHCEFTEDHWIERNFIAILHPAFQNSINRSGK